MPNPHEDDELLDWLGKQAGLAWQATKPFWLSVLALYIGWVILRSIFG